MEFGTSPQTNNSPDIDDATRIAAMTRQTMLEPLHADIIVDDVPDEVIAREHLTQPAVANVSIDTETTTLEAPARRALPASKKSHTIALISSLVGMGLVGLIIFIVYSRP